VNLQGFSQELQNYRKLNYLVNLFYAAGKMTVNVRTLQLLQNISITQLTNNLIYWTQ